jgi:hypothetical protein
MNACCMSAPGRAAIDRELIMGTIIEFPAGRRVGASGDVVPRADMGTILILPVIRIERESDEPSGDHGPEQGTAPGRRRRRR